MTQQFTLQLVRFKQFFHLSPFFFPSIHRRTICPSEPTSLHNVFMIESQFSLLAECSTFYIDCNPRNTYINFPLPNDKPLPDIKSSRQCENEDGITSQVVSVGKEGQ